MTHTTGIRENSLEIWFCHPLLCGFREVSYLLYRLRENMCKVLSIRQEGSTKLLIRFPCSIVYFVAE